MPTRYKLQNILNVINKLLNILSVFFWIGIIFGFEDYDMAIATTLSVMIHEGGHILYLYIRGKGIRLKGVVSGFRLKAGRMMSYGEQAMLYASGVGANLISALLFIVIQPLIGDCVQLFIFASLATAISNLMPIKGYDGYGLIKVALEASGANCSAFSLLSIISTALIFTFCILSLYLIDRCGLGYWIFAVFFVSMLGGIGNVIDEANFKI